MKKNITQKTLCLLSSFVVHTGLIGMQEINLPKKEILSHHIIVNNNCTQALIHNYYKRNYCREAERYTLCADLIIYDLIKKETVFCFSVENCIPIASTFINDKPITILFDLKENKILSYEIFDDHKPQSIEYEFQNDECIPEKPSVHTISKNKIKAITIGNNIVIIDKDNKPKSSFKVENKEYDLSISSDGAYLLLGSKKSELWNIALNEPQKIRTISEHCEFSINSPTYDFFAYNDNMLYNCEDESFTKKFDENKKRNVLTFSKNYYISQKTNYEKIKLFLHDRNNSKNKIEILDLPDKNCLYNYSIKISENTGIILVYPTGKKNCSKKIYKYLLKSNKE